MLRRISSSLALSISLALLLTSSAAFALDGGSVDAGLDGDVDASLDAALDAPADAPADAPKDAAKDTSPPSDDSGPITFRPDADTPADDAGDLPATADAGCAVAPARAGLGGDSLAFAGALLLGALVARRRARRAPSA